MNNGPGNSKSFTITYRGIASVLKSEALIHKAFNPVKVKTIPQGKEYTAIWDTGATNTVITKKVAGECGLKAIGMVRMNTAGGVMESPVYMVNITLPSTVCISGVKVSQSDSLGGNADILIGMDIIASGDFAVTSQNGQTVFSFRFPSHAEKIDFIEQHTNP